MRKKVPEKKKREPVPGESAKVWLIRQIKLRREERKRKKVKGKIDATLA